MKELADLHMHTIYSDGKNSVEVMILSAVEKGFNKIAITDHMPVPFDDTCAMKREKLEQYREEVISLRKKYAGKIDVLLGMEMDYLPNYLDWVKEIMEIGPWDVTIGSIHFFEQEVDEKPIILDMESDFQLAYENVYKKDIKSLCRDYYQLIQKMVKTEWFNVVGHFDVLKKYNSDNKYFDEKDDWYKEAVLETLEVIQGSAMKLEINTAGLDKAVGVQYPSIWIIDECRKRDISLQLNSDAHKKEDIGNHFDEIRNLLN